ncbi:MAG: EAL domain-containing protein [Burkholderiales bacterium]|nr:EAL domain-containing protein [Burkholderiales bacterium]
MMLFDDTTPLMPELRARRLAQVLLVASVAVALSLAHRIFSGNHGLVLPMMLATLGAFAVAAWLLRRGRQNASAALMLGSLMVMLGYFMVRGQGLRDVAMLGMPGILVFAALLGNRRLFAALLVAALAVCVGVGVARMMGWWSPLVSAYRPTELLDVCVILLATAFAINMLAGDLAATMRQLVAENRAVRESQRRIEHLANRDLLTGLPNRMAARERFEQAVELAHLHDARVALLYLDLDHFKNVNDSLGHPAGDRLLCQMAERLAPLLGGADTLSRLGGDEFLVLLGEPGDNDRVADLAGRMLAAVAAPLQLDAIELHAGASIGVAIYPEDGADFDMLLKKADIAMYRAKDAGRNLFRFFDAKMNASVGEHLQMVAMIRQALARGEFEVHYQPQIDLRDGRVVGAEALLRWRHPDQGMISPARFIPVAEHSGQIVELGAWVLAESCRQAAQWRDLGFDDLVVSVNMSPVQARRGDLERAVFDALRDANLPPQLLELELTETLLAEETEAMNAMFKRLRAVGITFAIDDFGTGYSNLAYLKRFEVERLKIDQSFIRRLTVNADDEAIVSAILQMAGALRLGVIAEGVEDADTLARLRALGCSQGQGYHWSPALPPARFEAFVRERQAVLATA